MLINKGDKVKAKVAVSGVALSAGGRTYTYDGGNQVASGMSSLSGNSFKVVLSAHLITVIVAPVGAQ